MCLGQSSSLPAGARAPQDLRRVRRNTRRAPRPRDTTMMDNRTTPHSRAHAASLDERRRTVANGVQTTLYSSVGDARYGTCHSTQTFLS